MSGLCIPDAHAESIYVIDPDLYLRLKLRYLFIDLDNTLDPYDIKVPSPKALDLFDRLRKAGLQLIITSNNSRKRVSTYAGVLKAPYIHHVGKPFAWKVRRYLSKNRIAPQEALMIGDSLFTDVICAKRAHLRIILTEPLCKRDQPMTRFHRVLDKRKRKRMAQKGVFKDWRDIVNG